MHRYISSTQSFGLRCWTVEIYYNLCNQAKFFYFLILCFRIFFQSDRYTFVNFNTKHIIQTIRFITFPELRTSKNIYPIRKISTLVETIVMLCKKLEENLNNSAGLICVFMLFPSQETSRLLSSREASVKWRHFWLVAFILPQ